MVTSSTWVDMVVASLSSGNVSMVTFSRGSSVVGFDVSGFKVSEEIVVDWVGGSCVVTSSEIFEITSIDSLASVEVLISSACVVALGAIVVD